MDDSTTSISHKKRKIFLIFFFIFLTLIVLIVGSYAWFVGTGVVDINSFILDIGVEEGLEISLDGENWTDSILNIDKNALLGNSGSYKAYDGNKNKWPETGLLPISSNGVVDSTNGRLVLYRKSAITATNGGFRFIANQIDNSLVEKDGYLAFDLFIRNGTGYTYTNEYEALDDEAVYLTRNSSVIVTQSGSENDDYGLGNSLRVAFMQVGRVKHDTEVDDIVGINCTTDTINTGLCSEVTSTIWEPNSSKHNSNLITHFNSICKNRTDKDNYTSIPCTTFTDGQDVDTYVIKQPIVSSTLTDMYDGHNTYSNDNLNNLITFTDVDKLKTLHEREAFFYLSANSVTKVRVYIYLEGQDVDNYDLISNGNKIAINFGFTKDKFSEEDGVTPVVAENSLYYKVMSQASDDTIDFHYHSSATNHVTNGVYKTNATESGKTVYYYRGNVDNHVIFNNMCWRIVRTTETGGVKLIYNGVPSSGKCTATGASTQIGTSKFNTNYDKNAYEGYMYGTPGSTSYAAEHANTNNSTIKTYIDNWYNANFTDSNVTSKVEDTVYCNDRSTVVYDATKIGDSSYSSYGTLGYGTNTTLYGAINRSSLYTINPNPTLTCSNTNDKFTVNSSNGNGALTYPVGLITNDEAVFAGFNTSASNTSDYLDTNNYLYTGQHYWTMTPVVFYSGGVARVGFVNSVGSVGEIYVVSTYGVRPAVSLVDGTLVGSSGDGSSNNPYVVE